MSYRHSNYRKHKVAMKAARESVDGVVARHYGNRISHWLNARPLDKPEGWGWAKFPRFMRR